MNSGGSYIKDKNGKETQVAGTTRHPDGDRGRTADGKELRQSAAEQKTAEKAKADAKSEPKAKIATATAKKGDK